MFPKKTLIMYARRRYSRSTVRSRAPIRRRRAPVRTRRRPTRTRSYRRRR